MPLSHIRGSACPPSLPATGLAGTRWHCLQHGIIVERVFLQSNAIRTNSSYNLIRCLVRHLLERIQAAAAARNASPRAYVPGMGGEGGTIWDNQAGMHPVFALFRTHDPPVFFVLPYFSLSYKKHDPRENMAGRTNSCSLGGDEG